MYSAIFGAQSKNTQILKVTKYQRHGVGGEKLERWNYRFNTYTARENIQRDWIFFACRVRNYVLPPRWKTQQLFNAELTGLRRPAFSIKRGPRAPPSPSPFAPPWTLLINSRKNAVRSKLGKINHYQRHGSESIRFRPLLRASHHTNTRWTIVHRVGRIFQHQQWPARFPQRFPCQYRFEHCRTKKEREERNKKKNMYIGKKDTNSWFRHETSYSERINRASTCSPFVQLRVLRLI